MNTTIELPEELMTRVAELAESRGETVHDFIVAALEEKLEREESSADFFAIAQRRYEQIVETGLAIPWSDARRYMLERAAGKSPPRPVARKILHADVLKRLHSKKSD